MKSFKRVTALVLTALLVLSSCPVFAAGGYSDVSSSYWALNEIVKCREYKIFEGFTDGTFRPKTGINQQQVIVMLYRILKHINPGFDDTLDYTEDWAEELEAGQVGDWAQMNVAYAFQEGYVDPAELAKSVAKNVAKRSDVAVWTAKALGYELSALSVLPYTDSASIEAEDFIYLDAMYRHDIMHGTSAGSFGPNDDFTRAQMAAIAIRIADQDKRGDKMPCAQVLAYKYGTLTVVNDKRRTLLLECDDNTYTLRIAEDATILLDGRAVSFSDLASKKGTKLRFSSVAGAENLVLVQTGAKIQTGTITATAKKADYTLVTVQDANGVLISLVAPDASKLTLPSTGSNVSYISDGAELITIQ